MLFDHLAKGSLLQADMDRYPYRDSAEFPLPRPDIRPEDMVRAFALAGPRWFYAALKLRDQLVRPFGLIRSAPITADLAPPFTIGQRIGPLRLLTLTDREAVLGENDRHLDVRVSFLLPGDGKMWSSTLVATHNALGRAYMAVVLPFHRALVPVMGRRMVRFLA